MMEATDFVAAMRKALTAVSIVTTDGILGRHGATVSAACSLSAAPPSVLICLNRKSRILGLIEEHGTFCINFLPEGCQRLALAFSGSPESDSLRTFGADLWTNAGSTQLPILRDAVASFCCLHMQTIPFGSHRILIGKVELAKDSERSPLAYWDGKFRTISVTTPDAQRSN